MSNVKKLMMSAAGGEALNVEDVFDITLHFGNNTSTTITNGLDLSTEGGMVWTKRRKSYSYGNDFHYVHDTERGSNKYHFWNERNAEVTSSAALSSFNTDGFTVGTSNANNQTGEEYVYYSFRKCPRFFDVVTYTGNGSSGRTISHNLDGTPGCIMVKRTSSSADDWAVYHRGAHSTSPQNYYLQTNDQQAPTASSSFWNNTAPTSSVFTVGNATEVNSNGETYVAYLWAHNDGDGEFGPNGDQDIIKCGRIYTDSSGNADIDLGFEPQFIILKAYSNNWWIIDDYRGWLYNRTGSPYSQYLQMNTNSTESNIASASYKVANGLAPRGTYTNTEFYYIAVSRDTKPPEDVSDVFDIATRVSAAGQPLYTSTTGSVDFMLDKKVNDNDAFNMTCRITGNLKSVETNNGDAEGSHTIQLYGTADTMLGATGTTGGTDTNEYAWMWKRSKGFCDVVNYAPDGSSGYTVTHGLGVAPEMIWIKNLDSTDWWRVYHSGLGETKGLYLNRTNVAFTNTGLWNDTAPTSTEITLGNDSGVNLNNYIFTAFLFATKSGFSKVGSYTGTSTTQTIDCGFSSGARFVIIKRTDASDDWYLYDSDRGIVSGNDNLLLLNTTGAESTSFDFIDPQSSGFSLPNSGSFGPNVTGGSYIFYAIA